MSSNDTSKLYFNRELSWLEFNQRVLDQAIDAETPLLERVKFLAITGSNLDEFFMVRVGGLMIQARQQPNTVDIAGMSAAEQLQAIRDRVNQMVDEQYRCLNEQLLPQLANHGIRRLTRDEISVSQQEHLQRVFDEEIVSVVSPIAVSGAEDFPSMIGATLGLCVRLRGRALGSDRVEGNESADESRFVVVPMRRGLQRILTVPSDEGVHFVIVEDALAMFADQLFPDQEVLETVAFRTIRNGDVTVDEDAADLMIGMQAMLDQRQTSDCVWLEIDAESSQETQSFLQQCVEVDAENVHRIPGPPDLAALFPLATVSGFRELKYEPWPPHASPDFRPGENIFEVIAQDDRVLFHPYQQYQPVVDFVVAAAADPQVIAIKQTLYRTSRDSEMVNALRQAAESGKHVTVVVELKARFDEKRNIDWARKLEEAGVDVIYGVRGLKTHAKICLVVRRESHGIRRYMHFGTGNYNESTAQLYCDISLFTCNPELGNDAVKLFNAVTGMSVPRPMTQLIAAPLDLRNKISEMIDVEIATAESGRPAMIRAKVNSLLDQQIIDHLYQASQAGVQIELNVRGICCLKPGVPGLSENIRVTSIVDRLLEHARVFYFLHGGDHRTFIASADWMTRNLDRRVELLVPVLDPECARQVQNVLVSCLQDNVNAWQLDGDGQYDRLHATGAQIPHRSQVDLYTRACELDEAATQASRSTFRPHRASHESA